MRATRAPGITLLRGDQQEAMYNRGGCSEYESGDHYLTDQIQSSSTSVRSDSLPVFTAAAID